MQIREEKRGKGELVLTSVIKDQGPAELVFHIQNRTRNRNGYFCHILCTERNQLILS